MKFKLPGRLRSLMDSINSEKRLEQAILANAALLEKLKVAEDADTVGRAIVKRGKLWSFEAGITIESVEVDFTGKIRINGPDWKAAYSPEFDVDAIIYKKSFAGLRRAYLGKVHIKGALGPEMEITIVEKDKQTNPKDIELKKYAVFALVPAYIEAILKPITIEVLGG